MGKNKKNKPQPQAEKEKETKSDPPAENTDDEKLDVSKSVFQVNREMQKEKQRELEEKQAELLRQHELREKKKQEAYEKRILEEKKELIRLKQGLIEESEVVQQEEEVEVKRSLGKRFVSFIYLNKWWLCLAVIFVTIFGLTFYSLITRKDPDTFVLFIDYNYDIGEAPGFEEYLSQFTADNNNDGKNEATLYYIPLSDNDFSNYQLGVDAKVTSQLQAADAAIVFGGDELTKYLEPAEDYLVDLEEMFPGNPHVEKYKFKLKGSKFAERIGVEEKYVTDELYLAIRKPMKLPGASEEKMQKTYNRDIEMFKAIIKDLT